MNTAEVITICQQLTNEGKEPSVALIKSRLSQATPLPLVIAGLKTFKANPSHIESEIKQETPEPVKIELEQRVESLEQQVAELKRQLSQLVPKPTEE